MVIHRTFIHLAWLLIFALPLTTFAAVSARVDKTIIAQDDTLNLTLRIDRAGARAPDLSALEKDFYIVGTNKSSRHSYTNGKAQSSTEWFVNLIPQHSGRVVIPSFIIEGESTQPITLQVKAAGSPGSEDLQPIFLETEVSKSSVYVQEQLTFTIRLNYAVQIEKASLPDPVLINASLKKIGENSFDKLIKGVNYRVFERTYALFPQQAGELVIPPVLFSAIQPSGRNSLYRLQQSGTPVRKLSREHKITVRPPPASFSGDTWLPAQSLKLVETWSSNPREIRVGESITRTITSSAQNLLAAQLPPLEFESVPGIKLYPDKGSLNSTENDRGVFSTRVDSTAIIPTREGEITLPAIRVRWWDTTSNRSRVAVIPESKMTVKPALEEITNIASPKAVDHSQPKTIATQAQPLENTVNPWWPVTSAVLLCMWLLTLVLYLRLRIRTANSRGESGALSAPESIVLPEKKAFKVLARSARSNDLQAIRKAVITWAQCFWPEAGIKSLEDIRDYCDHPSLNSSLAQLDNALYGSPTELNNWNSENLLSVIKLIRQKKPSSKPARTALPPLYKNR